MWRIEIHYIACRIAIYYIVCRIANNYTKLRRIKIHYIVCRIAKIVWRIKIHYSVCRIAILCMIVCVCVATVCLYTAHKKCMDSILGKCCGAADVGQQSKVRNQIATHPALLAFHTVCVCVCGR